MFEVSQKLSKHILNTLLLFLIFTKNSFGIYDAGPREMDWDSNKHHCIVKDQLEFDPLTANRDINWELTNAVCMTYIATVAATNTTAAFLSNKACVNPAADIHLAASIAAGVGVSPQMAISIAQNTGICSTLISAQNYGQAALCCGSVAANVASMAANIAALAAIYGAAKIDHQNAKICGSKWFDWRVVQSNDNSQSYNDESSQNGEKIWQKGTFGKWKGNIDDENSAASIYKKYQDGDIELSFDRIGDKKFEKLNFDNFEGSYAKYLRDKRKIGLIPNPGYEDRAIEDKEYRELLYGGVEYSYGGCQNPDWENKKAILGYNGSDQRYYMKGASETPNYACYRFLNVSNSEDYAHGQKAYNCCVDASQKLMCIKNSGNSKFCKLGGSRCKVKDVWYEVYQSRKHDGYLCAKTYSVCPYNHPIGGGTEEVEYVKYNDSQSGEEIISSDIKNYCQYLKHCSKIPSLPYQRTIRMEGDFIADACFNLKGDSQNSYSYQSDLLPINTSHFSAPIAQCFYETFYNLFVNKAGHNKCSDPMEVPNKEGNCPSGNIQKIGDSLVGDSFFTKLQNSLKNTIKLVLTLSIVLIGYRILGSGEVMKRKDLSVFIIKIALIAYFALGNAWQETFFNGIYKSSAYISDFVTRIDESKTKITSISTNQPIIITVKDDSEIVIGDQIKITNVENLSILNNQIFTVIDKNLNDIEISPTNFSGNQNDLILDLEKIKNSITSSVSYGADISLLKKLDGCQFPRYDYTKKAGDPLRYNNPQYPPDKEYLRIWDSIDCRIIWALGMSPDATVPNLFLLILASFFTGGLGIIFMFAGVVFVFFLISLTVKALHMFLISSLSIIIMVYISPLTITTSLFKKTDSIFKKWFKNLFGFIMQPVILFAYLGIFLTIYDIIIAGDIEYEGDGLSSPKSIKCAAETAKYSVYCIFSELGINSNNIKYLGIAIPSIDIFEGGRMKDIVFTLVKSAFLMFIFNEFFSKISDLAKSLIDSKELSVESSNIASNITNFKDKIRSIQKRGAGLSKNIARSGSEQAIDKYKNNAQKLGDKGKKVSRHSNINDKKPSS